MTTATGKTELSKVVPQAEWLAARKEFLKKEKELGTLAPGRFADVIAVRGDVLTHVDLLQRVDIVVKNGVRVK